MVCIEKLIAELEDLLKEQTVAANVATVAVPLGGVSPGAQGGSIKPWGNWDDPKEKQKQFKRFNMQLAKGKMPKREASFSFVAPRRMPKKGIGESRQLQEQTPEDDAIRGTVDGTDKEKAYWEHDQDSDVTHCLKEPHFDEKAETWVCDSCGYRLRTNEELAPIVKLTTDLTGQPHVPWSKGFDELPLMRRIFRPTISYESLSSYEARELCEEHEGSVEELSVIRRWLSKIRKDIGCDK